MADAAKDSVPERKTFGLKPIEQQLLNTQRDAYFNSLSNVLSFLAIERLAYNVTNDTRFQWDDDKLQVWEEPEAPAPPEAEVVEPAPSNLPKA